MKKETEHVGNRWFLLALLRYCGLSHVSSFFSITFIFNVYKLTCILWKQWAYN